MFRNFLIVSFVLVLTFGVYIQTVNHAFIIWDDDKNIYENPHMSQYHLGGIKRYWKGPFIGLYIPVTYTVWSLIAYDAGTKVNYGAGPDPVIDASRFHLANVALHTASVGLVILLFYQLLGRQDVFAAAVGASLFALHPLQVEPVAWATGLKDTLSGFLALICVLLYLAYSRYRRRGSTTTAWILYATTLILYIIALLSKPQLVVIPPIIAILLWSQEPCGLIPGAFTAGSAGKRKPGWDHWDTLMAMGILTLLCARIIVPWPDYVALVKYGDVPPFHPLLDITLIVCAAAFGTVLWKRRSRPKNRAPSFFGDAVLLAPFFIVAVTFVFITKRSQPAQDAIFVFDPPSLLQRPFIALDALGFYISKLVYPFGLTVDYGRAPAKALDLALSHPIWIIPIFVGVFFFVPGTIAGCTLAALGVAFVAIGPVLGFLTFAFQGQSTVADRYVYLAMIGIGFALAIFLTYAGNALPRYIALCILPIMAWISFNQVAKWKNSETLFKYALTVNPASVASNYNLALTYSKENQYQGALDYYQAAINLKDDFSHPWNNMGHIMNSLRRYREAIPYLERAIEINPDFPGSYSNMGIAHDHLGEFDKSIYWYNKALEIQPVNPPVFVNLGLAYFGKKDWERAVSYFKRASDLSPNLFQAYSGMGDCYVKLGNYPAAVDAYYNLVNLSPESPRHWRALAHAYACNGQFEQAVRHMERAVSMLEELPEAGSELIALFKRNLEDFRNGRVEPPKKPVETEKSPKPESPAQTENPQPAPSS